MVATGLQDGTTAIHTFDITFGSENSAADGTEKTELQITLLSSMFSSKLISSRQTDNQHSPNTLITYGGGGVSPRMTTPTHSMQDIDRKFYFTTRLINNVLLSSSSHALGAHAVLLSLVQPDIVHILACPCHTELWHDEADSEFVFSVPLENSQQFPRCSQYI